MNSEGDRYLQRFLWLTIAVFVVATFLGGSFGTGVAAVFCLWFVVIVGGMALDALWPKNVWPNRRHPKP